MAMSLVRSHAETQAGYRELVLEAPTIAPLVRPGQFVHLRIPRLEHRLLRRPFSIYKADQDTLTILYKSVGTGTQLLTQVEQDEAVSLLGPLGNGFPEPRGDHVPLLVAGGYGVAPLYLLASRMARTGVLFIGARTRADILCDGEFEALGWDVQITTEDGSRGMQGLVTSALDVWAENHANAEAAELFACGPDGMLRATGERAITHNWKGWLSLDKHMGCGMGACLACVQRIRQPDGSVEWERVCRDGPIFEAREIVWEPEKEGDHE